jgi:hypothetical protein
LIDIFDMQDEVSVAIAGLVSPALRGQEQKSLLKTTSQILSAEKECLLLVWTELDPARAVQQIENARIAVHLLGIPLGQARYTDGHTATQQITQSAGQGFSHFLNPNLSVQWSI